MFFEHRHLLRLWQGGVVFWHEIPLSSEFFDELDAVLNLYIFDRQLRLHVLDAIDRVEVSVRSNWAYHFSHAHGAHAPQADRHAPQEFRRRILCKG